MTKWAATFACTLVLALAALVAAPQASFAASAVSYVDAYGTTQSCATYISITADTTSLSAGWYVVDTDVTVGSRMTVSGDVHLILTDGKTLTASSGIAVESGNSLTVYGQSQGSGALQATQTETGKAGIGGSANLSGGSLTVNGGTVTANGGLCAAGIGGGQSGAGGTVTVNGGTVTATGGEEAAGIGGGQSGAGGTITVNGGTVTATGGSQGAGIGGGFCRAGGTVTVNGGTVTANGGQYGAGIGGGYYGAGGTVLMTGGVIAATVGSGSYHAIGGGLGQLYSPGSLYVSPAANTDIYAEAGSAAGSTTAVSGSPFASSRSIISNVLAEYVKLYSLHTHSWTYSASGATLTATCSSESSHTASLTVSAPADLTYSGSAKTASLSDTSAWTGYGLTVPTISYSGDTTNVSSAGATASITAGSATASVSYQITAKTITPTIDTIDAQDYTGSQIKPAVTVKDGTATLPDSAYALVYGDNINAGTNAGSVTVKAVSGGNYTFSDVTATFTITPSGTAPNAPSEYNPGYTVTTLAGVDLPAGWEWADSTTALEVGVPVTATAKYTAADAGNYVATEVSVTVTRSACMHPADKQETRDAKAATATEAGYTGDTYCTQCGEVTAKGSAIPATGSDADSSADSSNGSSSTTVLAETGDAATPFAATAFACALAALAAAGFAIRKCKVN